MKVAGDLIILGYEEMGFYRLLFFIRAMHIDGPGACGGTCTRTSGGCDE